MSDHMKKLKADFAASLKKHGIPYVDLEADKTKWNVKDLEGLPSTEEEIVTLKSFNSAAANMIKIDDELAEEGFVNHRLGDDPQIRISIGPKCMPLSMKARSVGSAGGYGGSCISLSAELNLEGELLKEWIALRDKIIAAGQGWE